MTHPISDVTRRVVYSGSAGVGPYSFSFEVLDAEDVAVYKNSTLLTLTTNYTVSINANGTGSVTLVVAATSADTVTVVGNRSIERVTDFVTGGDLFANTLNDELDSQTIFAQQVDEKADRSIKAPVTDPTTVNMDLPSKTARANKILQFDTNGNPSVISTENLVSGLSGSILGANYTVTTATGDGSTVTFTAAAAPGSKNNIQVYLDGVYQNKATFSIAGYDITFTEAPPLNAAIEFVVGKAIDSYDDASGVVYAPAGAGAVATTVQAKLRESVSVLDFGADPTGVADSTAAFVAALAASDYVLVPAGTYTIDTQIDITGNKTISGLNNTSTVNQTAVITFTGGSGSLFSATSAEYDGICIRNLTILGGNGAYAIRSSRPQSVFENILMEPFNGGGIELFEAGTGSQASWSTQIKNVKWVAPTSATAYRGYQIDVNGGHVLLDGCVAIYGAIGINIDQGEAIDIYRCSTNQQSVYSSSAATDTCSIRLSGGGYKKAISIRHSYIEGFTYGIYVEKCESLSIEDNYIADLGQSSNYSSVYLKDSNVNNVTIRNNNFGDGGNAHPSVDIGDGANNVYVLNNDISSTGTNAIGIRKGATTTSYIAGNKITVDVSGYSLVDPNYLLFGMDFGVDALSTYKRQNFTSADNTWYDLGPVPNDSIWRVTIVNSPDPSTWRVCKDLFVSTTGTATFETIYSVEPGYANRQLQVSGGILQFRTVSAGGNTANTVSAVRVA